jgi:hypothetical protein
MQMKIAMEEATKQVKSLAGDIIVVTRELKKDLETIKLFCNLAQQLFNCYKLMGVWQKTCQEQNSH